MFVDTLSEARLRTFGKNLYPLRAASIMATMPAFIAAGSVGQAAATASKAGSSAALVFAPFRIVSADASANVAGKAASFSVFSGVVRTLEM